MTPPAPLTDDWLFWDPENIHAYPHSYEPWTAPREPEQLNLFEARNEGSPLSLDGRGGQGVRVKKRSGRRVA